MLTPLISTNVLLQPPSKLEAEHTRWSRVMNIASKASMAALATIALTATSIVLFGITLTGSAPLLFIGSVLSTPLWMLASAKCADESSKATKLAKEEHGVAEVLAQLKEDEFAAVCSQLSIDPSVSLYTPEQLAILIARLAFWSRAGQALLAKANRHIYADAPENEICFDESKMTPAQASLLRYAIREIGFTILEDEALPAMLQSALVRQVLDNPSAMPSLSAVGTTTPKPIAVRITELFFDNRDIYMTFHDASRPPMTRQEIIHLFNTGGASALQQRIFA
jgi:hypothetical protein